MKPDAILTMNPLLSLTSGTPVASVKGRVGDAGQFDALLAYGSALPRLSPAVSVSVSAASPIRIDGGAASSPDAERRPRIDGATPPAPHNQPSTELRTGENPAQTVVAHAAMPVPALSPTWASPSPVIASTMLPDEAAPFSIADAIVAARSDPIAPPLTLASAPPRDREYLTDSIDAADGKGDGNSSGEPAPLPPQSRTAEPQPPRPPARQTRAVPGKTLPPAIAEPIAATPELATGTHDGDMATEVDEPAGNDIVALASTFDEPRHPPSMLAFQNATRLSDVDPTVGETAITRAEPATPPHSSGIGSAIASLSDAIDGSLSKTPLRREVAVLAAKDGEHGRPPADRGSSGAAPAQAANANDHADFQSASLPPGHRTAAPIDRSDALDLDVPAVKDAAASTRAETSGTRAIASGAPPRLSPLDDAVRIAMGRSQANAEYSSERTDSLLRTRPKTAFSDGIALPLDSAHTAQLPPAPTLPAPSPVDTTRQTWLTAMIDRIETMATPDTGGRDTRITLSPDALGEVSMRLVETDRGIEVALDAASPEARALLAEAAPRLAEMAEARGLRLSPHTGGEAGDGRHRAPQQPQSDAPVPNRRASTMADDRAADERIA